MNKISLVLRLVVAFIIGQTLFFKFSGAPEPVYIFTTLGVEPWGRLFTASVELVIVGLLLYKPLAHYGAMLAAAVLSGAIVSHLFVLGIVVLDDGGALFAMAVVAFSMSMGIVYLSREKIQEAIRKVLCRENCCVVAK